MKNPWVKLSLNAWAMTFEAATVIGLRAMKVAAGGSAAESEMRKMVEEKIAAGVDLQGKAMTGALGFTAPSVARKTLSLYRRKIRANRRRLTGG